ncbi:MAG: C25 family cysteine peptidase, partial [Thermoplasmatales archaeon]|nr:C25 family cysteine peptidase [Thermoplasmatales archaeon]
TNNALNASAGAYTFQDLASFKNTQGIATTIVTVENILNESIYWDSNPLFNDTQAIIRNFITDAYLNWGIEYVLLGGDGDGADVGGESGDNIIPVRTLYATAVDGDQGDQIPADMYYGCLDGNWNNDEDSYWGESGEDDLYAEVYVGRAAVDSTTELSNFVMKTLAYEATQDTYLFDVWMVGEYLGFGGVADYGGNYKDEIKDGSLNHGYTTVGIPAEYNVSTLYDRDYPGNDWPKSELIDIIDNNVHIINHLGHASVGYDMKLYNSDADALTNNRYFFGYSQGCYPGSIDGWHYGGYYTDYDCIAEHFTTESHGAFAFIANSRYGWGTYASTDGPSQHFDREFFDALFGENIRELGKANQDSKEDSIGFISDPIIRWCYYEINLFGDPTVRIKDAVKPEHDIEVRNIDAPTHGLPNETVSVVAGVYNNGQNPENVTIEFIVNSVTVNSTLISNMDSDIYQEVWFNWTPTANAVYNLCVYAEFVPGENVTDNNMANTTVIVGPDIAVSSIFTPEYIDLNTTGVINATITNLGLTNETGIIIDFIVNGTTVDNVSVSILAGESVD